MARGRKIALWGAAAVLLGALAAFWSRGADPGPLPQTVRLDAETQTYRPAGEFRQGTRMVDAPFEVVRATAIEVMKYHASAADYARCVAAGACRAAPSGGRNDVPQTNVNHADATAHAGWLSAGTGIDTAVADRCGMASGGGRARL